MPVGAKGPWFKESARRSEGRGDWREPNNPTEGRETTECATRESEGIAQFSFLQSVRQDVSQGRALIANWRCQSNGGSEGVDGQTFEHIEAYGIERWVDELAEELKRKDYRCSAVRRVWIGLAI